jgi:hypothetical protein
MAQVREEDVSAGWAYNSPEEQGQATMASTTTLLKRPSTLEQTETTDALTGMIIDGASKKARVEGGTAVAGYSKELSKALKSVVKIFTTMAR